MGMGNWEWGVRNEEGGQRWSVWVHPPPPPAGSLGETGGKVIENGEWRIENEEFGIGNGEERLDDFEYEYEEEYEEEEEYIIEN